MNPLFLDLKRQLEEQAKKGENQNRPLPLYTQLFLTICSSLRSSSPAEILVLWLDCDREGEAIAEEVQEICCSANRRLKPHVFRAKFSTVLQGEIRRALNNLGRLDMKQVDAVNARQEIDLRIGAAFTRFQTKRYQKKYGLPSVISYGPCQFPTLGFVVERWARIETFIPEQFFTIKFGMKVR